MHITCTCIYVAHQNAQHVSALQHSSMLAWPMVFWKLLTAGPWSACILLQLVPQGGTCTMQPSAASIYKQVSSIVGHSGLN
jgi:hypothetical protein